LKFSTPALYIFLLSLTLGGCAFTQANLNVGYDEAKAAKGPLSEIPSRQLTIGEFKDVRPERDKIGYKRNGYGMKTADILTQKPVPEIVREAVTAELSKNGHATASKAPELVLAGEITTFWFDTQINFWSVEFMGTVAMDLNVTDGKTGAPLLARKYQGHFNEKSLGGLDATWERVMNAALALMIEEMSTDTKLLEVLRKVEKPNDT
jgi:Uncharacterized lipoprotein